MNRKTKGLLFVIAMVVCLCMALTACGGEKKEEVKSGAAAPAAGSSANSVAVPESAPAGDEVVKEETKKEEIPFDVQETYSDQMAAGESMITQEGQNGEKEVTYEVTYVDGKEVNREVLDETVTKEPVAQIITYGTAQAAPQGAGGVYEVSREAVPSCADGSHGYYDITMSDGSHVYEEY